MKEIWIYGHIHQSGLTFWPLTGEVNNTDYVLIMVPVSGWADGSGLFQQDNAPCHKAKMVQEWFEEHNNQFEVSPWPPDSPDLNPIQHLWDVLDKVQSMEAPPCNFQNLKDLLPTSWFQIPQHTFRGLVESMSGQVRAVLEAKGGPYTIVGRWS